MKNNDFMIVDVECPGHRERLFTYLLDLMDKTYQEENWIKAEKDRSFYNNIHYAFEFLAEDLFDDFVEEQSAPYEMVGEYLKDKKESEIILDTATKLTKLVISCKINSQYISSPLLPELRKSAKEAFTVFMANEKDNKEFCNFVLNVIKKNRPDFAVDEKLPTYQNICKYIKSVQEF